MAHNNIARIVLSAVVLPLVLATSPIASATINIPALDIKNKLLVAQSESNLNDVSDNQATSCADPDNEGSLAQAQKEILQEEYELESKSIDIDKAFSIGKNKGCFAALADFPDLSIKIPSLTSIVTNLASALKNYATRKVCNAVNDAVGSAIAPLKNSIEKLSDSGQFDLTGRTNKTLTKKLYDIDPEIGRIAPTATSQSETTFGW